MSQLVPVSLKMPEIKTKRIPILRKRPVHEALAQAEADQAELMNRIMMKIGTVIGAGKVKATEAEVIAEVTKIRANKAVEVVRMLDDKFKELSIVGAVGSPELQGLANHVKQLLLSMGVVSTTEITGMHMALEEPDENDEEIHADFEVHQAEAG